MKKMETEKNNWMRMVQVLWGPCFFLKKGSFYHINLRFIFGQLFFLLNVPMLVFSSIHTFLDMNFETNYPYYIKKGFILIVFMK